MDNSENVYEEVIAPQEEVTVTHEASTQDDIQERNWQEMRRSQRELKELARSQQETIEQLKAYLTPREKDELEGLDPSDPVSVEILDKVVAKRASKIAREEIDRFHKEREAQSWQDKLERKYNDFSDVVNRETLDLLEKQDPELAESLMALKDPYQLGLQSYKYIKALGIVDKIPASRRKREVEKHLEKNENLLPSPHSYDKRPLAQAMNMANIDKGALAKELHREMMESARKVGFSY